MSKEKDPDHVLLVEDIDKGSQKVRERLFSLLSLCP